MNEQEKPKTHQEQAIRDFMRRCLVMQEEEQTIPGILAELGAYFGAEKAGIFEADLKKGCLSKTWQWCRPEAEPEPDVRETLPLASLEGWMLERGDCFLSSDPEDPLTQQALAHAGAECLLLSPFVVGGSVRGLLSLYNPRRNTGDLVLLSVAASVCYREISGKRREDAAEQVMTDRVNRGLANERRLHEANENLTTLLAEEKQYTAILGALSRVYYGLYYIDLEKNTFQELFSRDKIHHTLGQKADARKMLRSMTRELAADAYLPAMLQFTDFDTLDQRLGDKSILLREYAARSGGWTRCSFIPVERDETGHNRTVMCTLRWVTAEKEVESQGNLIQALAIPYANIYTVNADTREAVSCRLSQTMNERYGSKFAAGNYEHNLRTYIENEVLEEDRQLFDRISTVEGVNGLLAEQKAYYFNYRVLRDGAVRYYQCQLVKPNQDKNEFVIGFKDVNEEKSIELAAQRRAEEEAVVSTALSKEYSSLFKIDARTRLMSLYRTDGLAFDPAVLERLLAIGDYERILHRYIDAFIVPEDRERIRQSVTLPVLLEKVPEVGLFKLGFRRSRDGVLSHFEMNFAKTVDSSGAVTFILGLRDVDEETRRQLNQTRQLELQHEIIEGLGTEFYSILLVDPRTDTVAFYRSLAEHADTTQEIISANGHSWSKVMHTYAMEHVAEQSRAEYLEKMSIDYIRSRDADYSVTAQVNIHGELHYIQLRVAYVHEADGSHVVVIGTRNVDDLIRKERQQEQALKAAFDAAEAANRAKTDFLSHMSHDIRTPMNGIIGMTAIAAAHIDDKERVLDCLKKTTQASKHLLSLINEVLDMSKIESGKVNLVEEEFSLADLVENLITMMSPQIKAHRHELSVNISGVIHEAVVGDSLRIQKIFTNLMSNAVKYTPDGGRLRLSITEKPAVQPKVGCFEIVFEDNGIGMSEEFQRRIFEPFARSEDDSHVSHIQGTGLGMAISRNIVRMMGGDIKVESKLGVGSRFTVTMYLKLRDTAPVCYEKFLDLNVLVADDDAMSLSACCQMLAELGMKPDGVTGGIETVEKVTARHRENRDYFACILDWKMPDLDGIATTRAIRQAVGKDVPIIIISAYDWSEIEQEARAAGANAFISKPLFRSRMVKTFTALVGGREPKEPEAPLAALDALDLTGSRALLAEDNELNAEIAMEILGMTGLTVDWVTDGTQAVDRMTECAEGFYDLILMDIQMPKMNGYDAARAIRGLERSDCGRVPIVAMTANAFAEDVHAAKTAGMNEHIAKPLDMGTLARVLKKWIPKKN